MQLPQPYHPYSPKGDRQAILALDDDQYQELMVQVALCSIRKSPYRFDVCGPVTILYEGRQIKFIGMESYRLEAVTYTYANGEFDYRYYLKSKEALECSKLYNIDEKMALKLFMSSIKAIITGEIEVQKALPVWAEIQQERERAAMQKRYSDCDLNFGSW